MQLDHAPSISRRPNSGILPASAGPNRRAAPGARQIANVFGGSHAQRDVIDWTLTEAALRGGLGDVADALVNERLALRPHSPVNRAFLGRAAALAEPAQVAG